MGYKAIFFDWDGTAVESRTASVRTVLQLMEPLLRAGKKMVIVSGTTYENIAGGRMHELLPPDCLENLYLGLGRGAYNYGFAAGKPIVLKEIMPDLEMLLKIHRVSYRLHEELLKKYGICTDIVFSRPNYCKVDLMASCDRGDRLFMQQEEIVQVQQMLEEKGIHGGLLEVLKRAEEIGWEEEVPIQATTDAKYIELGISTKSDNIVYFMKHLLKDAQAGAEECCFWGDEFRYLTEGVPGSDAYMITEINRESDFFDVSVTAGTFPKEVKWTGGGIHAFHEFLMKESEEL